MSAGTPPSPWPEHGWKPSYIALLWRKRPAAPELVQRIEAAIRNHAPHLVARKRAGGFLLFADETRGRVHDASGTGLTIVGTLFRRDIAAPVEPDLGHLTSAAPAAPPTIDQIFADFWGSYVAFLRDERETIVVVRDPSGGLPAYVVDCGGAALVTDALPPWLDAAVGRSLPVDIQALANALAFPVLATHRSLLRNVQLLPAGCSTSWAGQLNEVRLAWDPTRFCTPIPGAAKVLRRAVLGSVAAWRSLHPAVVLELSGGLDSAIMLGALSTATPAGQTICLNLATTYASGDERRLARDAAELWRAELIEVRAREGEIDYRAHLSGPQPVQPVLYGLDPILEAASAGTASAFRCTAILTGQGGDGVFYQMPTDRVAIDYRRKEGLRALLSHVALDAARRTHSSVWRVQWHMLRDIITPVRGDEIPAPPSLLGRAARELLDPDLARHPWLGSIEDLPPGKQMQLFGIANCQLFHGPTRRSQSAALIHPLMSQPVVEAALHLPSYVLSHGTQDRALARSLFSDLLPASIARRRGKGEVSSYYRRATVENLAFLRAHLLDGCLVSRGLLDADALDSLLDERALLAGEEGRMVSIFASLEAWARHWGL